MSENLVGYVRSQGLSVVETDYGQFVVGRGAPIELRIDFDSGGLWNCFMYIRTSSWSFEGERTDLHHILAIIAGAALLARAQVSSRLYDEANSFSGVEGELYARYVGLVQPATIGEAGEYPRAIIDCYRELMRALLLVYRKGGRGSVNVHESRDIHLLTSAGKRAPELGLPSRSLRFHRQRMGWIHLHSVDGDRSVTFGSRITGVLRRFADSVEQPLEGPSRLIFPPTRGLSLAIDRASAMSASHTVTTLEGRQLPTEIKFVAMENWAVAIGTNTFVTWRSDDNGKIPYAREVDAVKGRQQRERILLFPRQSFAWSSTIPGDRFEDLVFKLLVEDSRVRGCYRMGATNEPDGGRDFVCDMRVPASGSKWSSKISPGDSIPENLERIVVQCKSSINVVGKSSIHSIRDTIEDAKAAGYILVVSSRISVPLWDHLDRLSSQGYFVEVWNRETLEARLNRSPNVLLSFEDIVKLLRGS